MNFLQSDLGYQQTGTPVEVTLGNAANVRLLDSINYSNFKSGRNYRHYGGYYRLSPVILEIPRAGRWHVVVDLGGYAGRVSASVRVLTD